MKPKWSDAPDWAKYLAMDANGEWYWYKSKPKKLKDCDCWSGGKYGYYAGNSFEGWKQTLEARPEPQQCWCGEIHEPRPTGDSHE